METTFDILVISDLKWNILNPKDNNKKKKKKKTGGFTAIPVNVQKQSTMPYHLDNPWRTSSIDVENLRYLNK